jgi:hypothetical protein
MEVIEPDTFGDTYLDKVYELLDRKIYFHDIMIRHKHFSEYGGKDKVSENIEKTREGIWDNPNIFAEKLMPEILKEVEIIKAKIA